MLPHIHRWTHPEYFHLWVIVNNVVNNAVNSVGCARLLDLLSCVLQGTNAARRHTLLLERTVDRFSTY